MCCPIIGWFIGYVFNDRLPFHGLKINTKNQFVPATTKARLFWNIYEGAEIRFVKQYLRPDLDVFELGSSLGVVSCLIRQKLNRDKRLVCVEANPSLAQQTELNLALNGFKNYVVLNKAVDYRISPDGVAHFQIGKSNTSGKIAASANDACTIATPNTSLSKLAQEFSLKEFALVCDIEGSEAGLLTCDQSAMGMCRQMLIELHATEFNNKTLEFEDLIKLSLQHGFKLTAKHGNVCVFDKPVNVGL